MSRIGDFIKNKIVSVLAVPMILGMCTFMVNLITAASDGVITDQEFHSLLQGASGAQTAILMAVMIALKIK